MSTFLRDELLNQQFARIGYVTMPLLSTTEVKALRHVYDGLKRSGNVGFYTTMNLEVVDDRLKVDSELKKIFTPKLDKLLAGYKPLFGNFTIKKPFGNSDLKLHLDWSVVDETKSIAIGVWVPLVDVDIRNGAFGVLEGSHLFGYTRRGSHINFIAYEDNNEHQGSLLSAMRKTYHAKLLCIPAGHAIVYDMRLAHFSPPNNTAEMRVACNVISIPMDATPVHYVLHDNGNIEELIATQRFFVTHNMVESALNDLPRGVIENASPNIKVEEQFTTEVVMDLSNVEIYMDEALKSTSAGKIGLMDKLWSFFLQ